MTESLRQSAIGRSLLQFPLGFDADMSQQNQALHGFGSEDMSGQ
jgi:hypothetical protein